MKRQLTVDGHTVAAGEKAVIDLNIARLVSGTKIDLPIHVYRSLEPGPVLLLSGGLHGDEVDGIEVIRRLIKSKILEKLKAGSVIAIPVMNIYGFLNFSREVPDGKDVNRYFPGSKNGSLASRVAYNLTNKVLKEIDYGIDFHTGGANRYNFPQSRFAPNDPRANKMAEAFNAPITMESKLIDRSLRKEAFKMGKSIMVYEGGESMRFDESCIQAAIEGAKRVMHDFGMIKYERPKEPTFYCKQSTWIRAKRSGLIQMEVRSGQEVNNKQILARITDPFGNSETTIKAPADGIIVGHSNAPVVNQGDALFHLGMA